MSPYILSALERRPWVGGQAHDHILLVIDVIQIRKVLVVDGDSGDLYLLVFCQPRRADPRWKPSVVG